MSTSAFAMLGALAWQVTRNPNKNKRRFFGWERRPHGEFFSILISPGSSSPWSLCALYLSPWSACVISESSLSCNFPHRAHRSESFFNGLCSATWRSPIERSQINLRTSPLQTSSSDLLNWISQDFSMKGRLMIVLCYGIYYPLF